MRIEAKNLIKIYGDRSVVNDVTFDINKGEVVCLFDNVLYGCRACKT